MTSPRYAELHAHSAFSFLDGASHPEELAAEAARLGLSALAMTDHDGLYGVVRFAEAARAVGLPTVFGAELHLPVPDATSGMPVNDAPTGVPDPRSAHLLVLARGAAGYRNLSSAIAMAHLDAGKKGAAHYDLETLGERSGGQWLVLTGCRKGAVRRALTAGGSVPAGSAGYAAARRELDRLIDYFGRENVVVEMTDSAGPGDSVLCDALVALAADAEVSVVATGNVHYARPRDADLAGALAAVRARSSLDDLDGWLPGAPTAHLRSASEMLQRHRRHPQAVERAAILGEECAFDLSLVAPNLPPYPVPEDHDEASWLRVLTERGATERYGPRSAGYSSGGDDEIAVPGTTVPGTLSINERAWKQVDHELRVINDLNFPGYFLVVYDLVEFCRTRGILAQGRGSAANSAVCYALGITAVDAVRHGLLFERFLAPERDGPPDIDIDIESRRREEVIQYVYERFGRTHAAQVANVISYRPRSAVRDAARALGHDVGQQDAWSKSIERWGSLRESEGPVPSPDSSSEVQNRTAARDQRQQEVWGPREKPTADDVHDVVPRHRPATAAEDGEIPDDVINLAERFLRLPRHLGIHSGGMVMCDRPVIEVCPVEWARMEGRTVLQWDKEDCADAGLVKFDLLGLGMLTAIRLAFESVAEHEGAELTLHGLPPEDPAVYDLLCAADTVGIFQVESRAQMSTLPRLQPRCFYDIVIEVALIRPGPIQGGSVHPYIDRHAGREPVTYLHPLLERSLSKTLGIPLFQEQLMQMAIDTADFTPAEADQLRRAMGSKRSAERMQALRDRLMTGMARNGITAAVGEQIFDKLRAFADFGFPESHAYSFAYLVYASSWLKVHHPAAFYAGLLAAQPMGFYSPQSLAADARRHHVQVLRPDVNASRTQACVERIDDVTLAVRTGLAVVRLVGEALADRIVEARGDAEFIDLRDLVRRVDLSTAQLEALATGGVLASLGVDRREALWAAGALAQEGPETLLGVSVGVQAPMLPGMTVVEQDAADVWATGMSPESFPTEHVRPGLEQAGVLTVEAVIQEEPGRRVAVGGAVTHRQRPGTAGGVTFLSLEDETGILNVICSPGLWKRFRPVARSAAAMVIRGRVECADGATSLVAEHLAPLRLPVATTSRDFQ